MASPVPARIAARVIEYVDHLHDHFLDPVVVREGHCAAPTAPGFSAATRSESIARYTCPGGAFRAADLQNGFNSGEDRTA